MMKKYIVLLMIPVVFCFYSITDNIITQLGIEEPTGNRFILNNFAGDFTDGFVEDNGGQPNSIDVQLKEFRIPYARLLPAVINGNKTQVAKELCAYVKTYVSSEAFMKTYAAKREKTKPTSEPWRPDAKDIQQQEEQIKITEKEIAKVKAAKQMPEAAIKAMDDAIAQQKKQIAAWKEPTPNKTKWDKNYPENPAVMIKARLEEYLQLAATVDFTATLTGGNKKKFTNPAYESKSLKWKAVYRAGKDVNTVVTAFVKDWLKEL